MTFKDRKDAEFLRLWLAQSDEDFRSSLADLRQLWVEALHSSFGDGGPEFEKKLTDIEEAMSLFFKAKRLCALPEEIPSQETDWMLKAREDFREKRYHDALSSFQKAIANSFPSTDELVLAGTCALYAGRLDYAGSYADQALRLDDEEVQALVLRALVAYRKEDYKESYAYLLRAKQFHPEHQAVLKYMPLVEKAMSSPFQYSSKESEARLKRRWVRKRVNCDLVINDYEQLAAMTVKVRSLSAGGCLVDPSFLPEEFDFILEFDHGGRVSGTAKKIYETNQKQVGLRFLGLNPKDEDLINQKLASLPN